jgi:hypothetical protein
MQGKAHRTAAFVMTQADKGRLKWFELRYTEVLKYKPLHY